MVGLSRCHAPSEVKSSTRTVTFLLHDVGIPDPIVQNGGPETYNKVRTPPLWGLRNRTLLMHDGRSSTVIDAILRHANQAAKASSAFRSLSEQNKQRLLTFLGSL